MDIQISTQQIELPDHGSRNLRRNLVQRFAQLATGISRLRVVLKDINGPRGGRDKVCILHARLSGGGELVVRERSEHLRQAIDRCARRCKSLIDREFKRRRIRHRRRVRIGESLPA